MKLKSIIVKNYRQFKNAKLTFDDRITILAGANNSGKTSLINLIKSIFTSENTDYSMYDIPAKNMKLWLKDVYKIFNNYFTVENSIESVDIKLVDKIIPTEETEKGYLMDITSVLIHVSYNPVSDDIKLFADYIMDLDEDKHDFYFMYKYEIMRKNFVKAIINNFSKLKRRFKELEEDKRNFEKCQDEKLEKNILMKERYLKQLIVRLYVKSIVPVVYFCDKDYKNKCKFDDVRMFRNLFHFCFIKASRPLDDDESDHSHLLSKQMIKMLKLDKSWNELVERLPDELLKPIQEREFDKSVRNTSLTSLKDTIDALASTNGGKSGELMVDMQITEDDISDLLQRITVATYNIDGYYLGESSQGLGYSNLIYIHLQLKQYENNIDDLKVNMFFLEEPESHMHPQMQQVFIKYLLKYDKSKLQGLITTHSNEIVRGAGICCLRVIRHIEDFQSELYDLSLLLKELKSSDKLEDNDLANFFDWFFEIGYSEIVFADKAIFYEGDTERLLIRKAMTLTKYKELSQQYIAFIQVGGAHAKNYEKLITHLKIKSLIITDIDYEKDKIEDDDILASSTTNGTLKYFCSKNHSSDDITISDLYKWKKDNKNICNDLIYICFQTDKDGYARTLEEAMLNKHFSMKVSKSFKRSDWDQKKKESKLIFSIPSKKNGSPISNDDMISVRDILSSSSNKKTDFMYSVIINGYVEEMMPEYIEGGLEWLMK